MSNIKRYIKTVIQYANPFGDMCVLNVPTDCNVVVLAVNCGSGLLPVKLLLPHQVYVTVVEDLVKKYNAHEVVAMPVNSNEYVSIIGNVCKPSEYAYTKVES
jgi:hypothetical protein